MSAAHSPENAPLFATPLQALAEQVSDRLRRHGVRLTLGGEPTLVPLQPEGSEWNFVAVGPTKLGYAYALAGAIIERFLPGAVTIFSPGKTYPGEVNPRWVVNLLANRDGTPVRPPAPAKPLRARASRPAMAALQTAITDALGLPADSWRAAEDPREARSRVSVLPLDHDGSAWRTERWDLPTGRGKKITLLNAEGPAGLRLPLASLPPEAMRRALTLEWREDEALHLFLPPLLQAPFCELLGVVTSRLSALGIPKYFFEGYLPQDEGNRWTRVGLTADPGVLEINIPPCETWHDYHRWLTILEETGRAVGLRSWKENAQGDAAGTGGGNHLLFGGPSLDENPFFARPAWVASLLRFFQAHPSLAYLFTGVYVGRFLAGPPARRVLARSLRPGPGLPAPRRIARGRPPLGHRRDAAPHAHGHHGQHPSQRDQLRQVLERRRPLRRDGGPDRVSRHRVAAARRLDVARGPAVAGHRRAHARASLAAGADRPRPGVARPVLPADPAVGRPAGRAGRVAARRPRLSGGRLPVHLALAFPADALRRLRPGHDAGGAPGMRGLAAAVRNAQRGRHDQPLRRHLHRTAGVCRPGGFRRRAPPLRQRPGTAADGLRHAGLRRRATAR